MSVLRRCFPIFIWVALACAPDAAFVAVVADESGFRAFDA